MIKLSELIKSANEEVIEEGLAKIIVPKMELYRRADGKIEPAWMPVFYNPDAIISRDLTVLFLRSALGARAFFFVDVLAGTGVRGIRISLEAGGEGLVNDVDPRAFYYIRRNIKLNNLADRLVAFNQEANTLLNNLTFTGVVVDYLDVDPYGSVAPFADSIFKPLGKRSFLGVTATDTAPLTCHHYRKTMYRYWVNCAGVDFDKELGARILISHIVMRGAALEIAARPLATIYYKHFYRAFFETRRDASEAQKAVESCIGYLWYCARTLERGFAKNPGEALDISCSDGSKPVVLGKVWICGLNDAAVVEGMGSEASRTGWITRGSLKLISTLASESSIDAPYVRLDKLCSILRKNMPPIERVVEALRASGFRASRTHFDPRGVKTDADISALKEIVSGL